MISKMRGACHTTCVQNAGPMSMEIFTGTDTTVSPFLISDVANSPRRPVVGDLSTMASLCMQALASGLACTDPCESEKQMAFCQYLSTVIHYPVAELICWLELRSSGQCLCCNCVAIKKDRYSSEHKAPGDPDHSHFLFLLPR